MHALLLIIGLLLAWLTATPAAPVVDRGEAASGEHEPDCLVVRLERERALGAVPEGKKRAADKITPFVLTAVELTVGRSDALPVLEPSAGVHRAPARRLLRGAASPRAPPAVGA